MKHQALDQNEGPVKMNFGMILVIAGAALCFAQSSFAVYKCSDGAGKTLYSDVPCVSGQVQQEAYGSQGRIRSSAPSRIDFGKSRELQRIKATAILESIRVDGRDCEWALKVDERQIEKCVKFVEQLRPGAEWTQVVDVVTTLLNDAYQQNESTDDYAKIKRLMADIVGYIQFAEARLAGGRK